MCGISGVVAKRRGLHPLTEVQRMNATIRHRGPDGEGYFEKETIALGHRRLAILDLTEHGAQPMERGGRYWITYNGEVYNYLELRRELQQTGETFATATDTEVILAAFA